MNCSPQGSYVHGILLERILEWVPCPPPGDLRNPGIEPKYPTLQADSLLSESPGKPKNTGVGNPSLLQQIFPTQESNWGLLHFRQILYQLSYREAPLTVSNFLPICRSYIVLLGLGQIFYIFGYYPKGNFSFPIIFTTRAL